MRVDRDDLNRQLKEAYKDSGTYVPFQMRARHPEAFERFIKAQTQMIATNYVIVLNHIGPDAMHYLSDRILAISGVLSLLPCVSVNEDGKYKVLVHQKNYHQVRTYLKDVVPKWYEEYVEPDAKAPDNRYPGQPEVSPIESDGISQGDHTYMTVSINTAMSISSNISNNSPPSFIYPKDQQSTTDESTLGGSQATSSNIGRSWADKVRGSRISSSSEPTSTVESERQRALEKELATSREEVAALKERLAKIEGAQVRDQELGTGRAAAAELKATIARLEKERIAEREAIDEKVRHQVNEALQVQFKSFAHEMTTMFSQMMMIQQISPQNITKRSVSSIIDNSMDKDHAQHSCEAGSKRLDNKQTPVKHPQNNPYLTGNEEEWQTPQYLLQIASQRDWTVSPESQFVNTSEDIVANDGLTIDKDCVMERSEKTINSNSSHLQREQNKTMLLSDDGNNNEQDSGTKSITKSLANAMETEALSMNHE
jgi:hypothetical protein